MDNIVGLPDCADLEEFTVQGGYGFVTPFVLVYGTLRKGKNNYERYLKDFAVHHGTFRIQGFQLSGIMAATSDDEDSTIVVDLFEICPDRNAKDHRIAAKYTRYMYEVNFLLDRLESVLHEKGSSYVTTILTIPDPRAEASEDAVVLAKFYQNMYLTSAKVRNETGDYLSPDEYIDYPILI